MVQKIGKHKTRTGREMRLTAQIRSVHFEPGLRCECPTKVDFRANVETCNAMVSDSAKDGESTKTHTNGVATGGDRGY